MALMSIGTFAGFCAARWEDGEKMSCPGYEESYQNDEGCEDGGWEEHSSLGLEVRCCFVW